MNTKIYIIAVSLLIIFGTSLGIYLMTESERNPIRNSSSSGEIWAIEYEYALISFPIDEIEKEISESSNKKFNITKIELYSDYKKRYQGNPAWMNFVNETNITHLIEIDGNWINYHELLRETFENTEGVKSISKYVISWIE